MGDQNSDGVIPKPNIVEVTLDGEDTKGSEPFNEDGQQGQASLNRALQEAQDRWPEVTQSLHAAGGQAQLAEALPPPVVGEESAQSEATVDSKDTTATETKEKKGETAASARLKHMEMIEQKQFAMLAAFEQKFAQQDAMIRRLEADEPEKERRQLQETYRQLKSEQGTMQEDIKEKWKIGQAEAHRLAQEIKLLDEQANIKHKASDSKVMLSYACSGIGLTVAALSAVIFWPLCAVGATFVGCGAVMTLGSVTFVFKRKDDVKKQLNEVKTKRLILRGELQDVESDTKEWANSHIKHLDRSADTGEPFLF
jgi:hypothetical protein